MSAFLKLLFFRSDYLLIRLKKAMSFLRNKKNVDRNRVNEKNTLIVPKFYGVNYKINFKASKYF